MIASLYNICRDLCLNTQILLIRYNQVKLLWRENLIKFLSSKRNILKDLVYVSCRDLEFASSLL